MSPPPPESGDASFTGMPDGPWTRRPAWRSRQIAAEAVTHPVLKLVCLLFGSIGLFALGQQGAQWMFVDGAGAPALTEGAFLALIFLGLAGSLGGFHFFEVVRARTAARGILTLASVPVPLGGTLRGQFDTGLPVRTGASARFRVRVGCYDRREGRGADGHLVARTRTLWDTETVLVSRIVGSPSRHQVSLAFNLPSDLPPTRAHTTDGTPFWRLRVTPYRALPGRPKNLFRNRVLNQLAAWIQEETGRHAYRADVSLPVFDVAPEMHPDAPETPTVPPPQYAQYTPPAPTTRGSALEQDGEANLTVTVWARRNPAILMLTLGGTLAAVLGTAVVSTVSTLAALICALAGVGFGYTAYRTLQPITLTVASDGLRVEWSGLLGTSTNRIPFEEIADARVEGTTLVIEQMEAALDDRRGTADLDTPASVLASVFGTTDDAVSDWLRTGMQKRERTLIIDAGDDLLEAEWVADQIKEEVARTS